MQIPSSHVNSFAEHKLDRYIGDHLNCILSVVWLYLRDPLDTYLSEIFIRPPGAYLHKCESPLICQVLVPRRRPLPEALTVAANSFRLTLTFHWNAFLLHLFESINSLFLDYIASLELGVGVQYHFKMLSNILVFWFCCKWNGRVKSKTIFLTEFWISMKTC